MPVTSADKLSGTPGTAQFDGTGGETTATGDGLVSCPPPSAHPAAQISATTTITALITFITFDDHILHAVLHTGIRPAVSPARWVGARTMPWRCRSVQFLLSHKTLWSENLRTSLMDGVGGPVIITLDAGLNLIRDGAEP